MNAGKQSILLLALLALAVGALVHQFNDARKAKADLATARAHVAALYSQLQSSRQNSDDLENEAAALTVEMTTLRTRFTSPTPATAPEKPEAPAAHALLLRINQERLANVIVTAVINGVIGHGFRQLFDLSEAEVQQLNTALRLARARVDAAIPPAQNVRLQNGYVVVELPAFNLGEEIREDVLSEFRATLGAARYAALESTRGIESIDRAFDGFGSSPRQITISRIVDGQPGAPGFRLMDGRRTAGGSSSAREIRFDDLRSLPAQYAWLVPVLPPLSSLSPPSGGISLTPSPAK